MTYKDAKAAMKRYETLESLGAKELYQYQREG
jgi:hypothetical protein